MRGDRSLLDTESTGSDLARRLGVDLVLAAMPDAVLVVDHGGRIRLANAQAERLFGYDQSELLGMPVEALVPVASREAHRAHRGGYVDGPRARPMGAGLELAAMRKDGTTVPVEISLSPVDADGEGLVIASVRDVTEHHREEARVNVLRAMPAAVAGADSVNDALGIALQHVCEATGWVLGEAWLSGPDGRLTRALSWHRGEPALAAFVEASRDLSFGPGEGSPGTVLAGGAPIWVEDLRTDPRFTRAEEGHRAGLRSVAAVPIAEGPAITAVIMFFLNEPRPLDRRFLNDLSALATQLGTVLERIHALAELRRRTAELELANLELEAFSHSVSHDLRAPIHTLDGLSSAILEDLGPRLDPEARDLLHRLRRASLRLDELLDALLVLSRITRQGMRRETVDLSSLARRILAHHGRRDPGRRVAVTIAPDLVVDGDPALLEAMMANLLGNAWKFTAKVPAPAIEVGVLESSPRGRCFFVRDNGAGFDPAGAGRLFHPFQRLHSSDEFEGTGVGLATVRRIVARHGGEVWAEGAVGKGATFYVRI